MYQYVQNSFEMCYTKTMDSPFGSFNGGAFLAQANIIWSSVHTCPQCLQYQQTLIE